MHLLGITMKNTFDMSPVELVNEYSEEFNRLAESLMADPNSPTAKTVGLIAQTVAVQLVTMPIPAHPNFSMLTHVMLLSVCWGMIAERQGWYIPVEEGDESL